MFVNGEKVFYKRKNFKGWKGPAMVIGQEGKIVLVRHGTAYYRCHLWHLMKVLPAAKKDDYFQKGNHNDKKGHKKRKSVSFRLPNEASDGDEDNNLDNETVHTDDLTVNDGSDSQNSDQDDHDNDTDGRDS